MLLRCILAAFGRDRAQKLRRLGGGIGTRGPGETQLETDKRYIRSRIQKLRENLELVRKTRAEQRRRRQKNLPKAMLLHESNQTSRGGRFDLTRFRICCAFKGWTMSCMLDSPRFLLPRLAALGG